MRTWDMKRKEKIADALWQLCIRQPVGDFLAEYKPYLTVQQILELSESSLISFGSHSKSHPMFNKLTYSEIKEEIIGSIEEIEKISGQKSKHFAYPYGLRPQKELEDQFIFEHDDLVWSLLGIKNCLTNNGNPFQWERDRQEFDYNLSVFRFLFLPVLRYYLK
jgi:peptidoglycan/xylan/chitin deacetylase (PgdA/CDA1 family)